tara:strand:- start:46 stop:594 length:549 start_codon:yes stop_codon:yes gene_type:complete
MKIQFFIFAITLFLIYDTYHDGKYSEKLMNGKKYMKMAMVGFIGLSLCILIRKHPNDGRSMLEHATQLIKYMPIKKGTRDVITPIFDFTKAANGGYRAAETPQMRRMMNSGRSSTKRSVSETKKKYVASRQGWKCQDCSNQLDATFEVDHLVELQHGGTNHVSNLRALCRNCHGKKTMLSNL